VCVMREAARIVAPGGVFLMDFLNASAFDHELSQEKPSVREERGATIEERREIVENGRVLVKHVRVRIGAKEPVEYSERLRLYRHDDLVAMAQSSGLTPRAVYGDYDLARYDAAASSRVILVCEKPGSTA